LKKSRRSWAALLGPARRTLLRDRLYRGLARPVHAERTVQHQKSPSVLRICPSRSLIPAQQPARDASNFTDRRPPHLRLSGLDILWPLFSRTYWYCLTFAVCRLRLASVLRVVFFSWPSLSRALWASLHISCTSLWLASGARRLVCSFCATVCRQWARVPSPPRISSGAVRRLLVTWDSLPRATQVNGMSSPPTPAPRAQFLPCHDYCAVVFGHTFR
jgi:hypothetical protein